MRICYWLDSIEDPTIFHQNCWFHDNLMLLVRVQEFVDIYLGVLPMGLAEQNPFLN